MSDTDEPIRALIATGFPYDRTEMPEALELFERFAALTRGLRRLGSTALDLCYVAAGRLDGYYERGIWEWDIAAGALILEEAGGKVTDYRGGELNLEGRRIVASNSAACGHDKADGRGRPAGCVDSADSSCPPQSLRFGAAERNLEVWSGVMRALPGRVGIGFELLRIGG